MKNNSIGTIAVSNTKRPRALFNFSSDLHTSMDFGSVIPGRVQMMVPNSKVVASSHEKIWCAPLLAPTMGRISFKAYHNFVRMSDLLENFGPMLSQESVSRGDSQFVPQNVPKITVADLSMFILFGASAQFYKRDTSGGQTNTDDAVTQWTNSIYSGTGANLASDSDLSNLGFLLDYPFPSFGGIYSYGFNPSLVFLGNLTGTHLIPLSNPRNNTFFPLDPSTSYVQSLSKVYDTSDITPDNADVVLPITLQPSGSLYYLCFRLSDFGKRLRKILIGCGYEINFNCNAEVSVLPLLAFYKSYFDVFGLTLYQNWEQSFAYRFLRSSDLVASPEVSSGSSSLWTSTAWLPSQDNLKSFFYRFMLLELGYCYYTDEQDFVSSHTRNTAVSPSPAGFTGSIITDVDDSSYNGAPIVNDQTTSERNSVNIGVGMNGHSYINSVIHGQLDSELLKRLYRWTNRNTIAGRRIAEILRAQGLGSYVDECKSDFIGSFEIPISIYDGISQSDTYSQVSDSGAPLGERFGSGEADSSRSADAERPFTFECNEFGYWITLFTIVPKGGYAEAFDPTVFAKSKFQFYNPEFDSLGMEFSNKLLVQGSQTFADFTSAAGNLNSSFGLVPRYFAWKFGRNVANGDFTRRPTRSSFSAYYLDKVIDVGARRVEDGGSNSTNKRYIVSKLFTPSDLPIAGNVWRYPTRYSFIGQFNRIFNYQGRVAAYGVGNSDPQQVRHELFDVSEDNFILHAIYDVQYFAPMLPVEDSFETYDDDNAVNGSMSKA